MFLSTRTHTHAHTHSHSHAYIYIEMQTGLHVCIPAHACMLACLHACIHTNLPTHKPNLLHAYIRTHTYTYTCMYSYIPACIHTRIHTDIHTSSWHTHACQHTHCLVFLCLTTVTDRGERKVGAGKICPRDGLLGCKERAWSHPGVRGPQLAKPTACSANSFSVSPSQIVRWPRPYIGLDVPPPSAAMCHHFASVVTSLRHLTI